MPIFVKTFLVILFSITVVITFLGRIACGKSKEIDLQYYDEEGNHIYYDRSLIEKKISQQRFPNISVRKVSRFFLRKNREAT